jgi:hypothetical protein
MPDLRDSVVDFQIDYAFADFRCGRPGIANNAVAYALQTCQVKIYLLDGHSAEALTRDVYLDKVYRYRADRMPNPELFLSPSQPARMRACCCR